MTTITPPRVALCALALCSVPAAQTAAYPVGPVVPPIPKVLPWLAWGTRTTFSIDGHGPSVGRHSCGFGPFFFQGDVLRAGTPSGEPELVPLRRPCIQVRGGFGAGTLQLGGYPMVAELDALSYATDAPLFPDNQPGTVWFSTDEFALGFPLGMLVKPSVESEAPHGEHGASVFMDTGLPTLPLPAFAAPPLANVQGIDGDGRLGTSGFTTPGLGLIEPNGTGAPPDNGDNLDAVDVDGSRSGIVLFSLDSGLADACSSINWTASAQFHGFSPASILISNRSGLPPILWAPAPVLGLDLAGFGTDDLDALAVWDDGDLVFGVTGLPFGWNQQGGGDMVLFSVRRGSAVIGRPDSLFGDPIEEGDVLMPPVAGGVSPFPAILVPAESLGLATRRSGTARTCAGVLEADDLDALDVLGKPAFDCDGNGREDALDVLDGTQEDANSDGVPDGCTAGAEGVAELGGTPPISFP